MAMEMTDEQFGKLVNEAMDELPQKYIKNLDNVAIVYEDEPTPDQIQKLQLRYGHVLFGLYEGIPRTQRGAGYNLVIPDKITIFKNAAIRFSANLEQLKANIKHTLWHEIAHHYGLDHKRIHELESKFINQ